MKWYEESLRDAIAPGSTIKSALVILGMMALIGFVFGFLLGRMFAPWLGSGSHSSR